MIRRLAISFVLILLLLGGGSSIFFALVKYKPKAERTETTRPPLLVRGLTLRPETVVEPIIGYGAARADRSAWVAAQVAGEVVFVADALHVGAAVQADDVLVRIDARSFQENFKRAESLVATVDAQLAKLDTDQQNNARLIEIARSEHEIAEREYNRVKDLLESGQSNRRELDISRQSLDAARRTLQTLENRDALFPRERAELEAARVRNVAELELARLDVEHCEVKAPFAGRIEEVDIDLGERAAVGQRLFSLLDPRHIEVPLELPVSLRGRVRIGAECTMRLESDDATAWRGNVARIAPRADDLSRTFSLYIEIDNDEQASPLLPGMFVRGKIDGPTLHDVLLVPRSAIQDDTVFLFDNGVARRRTVQTEENLLDRSVLIGVKPGETIITTNLDVLFDGRTVELERAGGNEPAPTNVATDGDEPAAAAAKSGEGT